jgi:hypothetical protein
MEALLMEAKLSADPFPHRLAAALREAMDDADAEVERLRELVPAFIESHSCVSTCCNAQPSAGDAKALADCVRQYLDKLRAEAK